MSLSYRANQARKHHLQRQRWAAQLLPWLVPALVVLVALGRLVGWW